MFSRFFIDRPIFAAVLSITITLAGGISAFSLPIAQFPSISPPTVTVTCSYPGASAKDVAEAVAAPIEQQVNGVENMLYMSSQCANDGSYNLTVTFRNGVDLNMATVMVQNRVSLAIPSLPDVIKQSGVTTRKRSPDILMGLALLSPDDRYDQLYMSNYAVLQIKDELARVYGVGDVFLFGQRDYSMRVWLNPAKMSVRNLTATEVVGAIREQNAQVAAGSVGQQPMPRNHDYQVTLTTLGRLSEPEQFENIILRAYPDGRKILLKDVGRVELTARSHDLNVCLDGKETVFLAIFQTPDANALDTRGRVLNKMEELKQNFPEGLDYVIGFDTTPYTRESIVEVVKTLRDAIILVAAVVLLFLQNWRSALIPLVAVPVAIIGTFAVMLAVGFSLNNLTLFGLVLAIGIVVDDAIVVVEAVEHHIENGLKPREATIKAMSQVSGPVVAVGLVLSAVFVPCAFISGLTGMFFRQFALTIAVSTVISAFNSLTLSPALTALLLRERDKETAPPLPRLLYALAGGWFGYSKLASGLELPWASVPSWLIPVVGILIGGMVGWLLSRPLNVALRWFFGKFNVAFGRSTRGYTRAVDQMLVGHAPVLRLLLIGLGAWAGYRFLLPHLVQVFPVWLALAGWGKPVVGFMSANALNVALILGAAAGWVVGRLVTLELTATANLLRAWRSPSPPTPLPQGERGEKATAARRFVPGLFDRAASVSLQGCVVVLAVYGGLLGLTYRQFLTTPKGFIPAQDMGFLMVSVQLPDSASLERTERVMRRLQQAALANPAVHHATYISGQSFVLSAANSNFGSMFIGMKDYAERRDPSMSSDAVRDYLIQFAATEVFDAQVAVFGPPPVRGVGRAGGFALMIEDRGDVGPAVLQQETDNVTRKGFDFKALGELGYHMPMPLIMFSVFRANVPQLHIEPDPRECMAKGVQLRDFADTLQIFEGSMYVNDFNLFGRTWQVVAQAEHEYRDQIEDLNLLTVRNRKGAMVPVGSLARVHEVNGPMALNRYNMYPAASINGFAPPGLSSGQVMDLMQRLLDQELPQNMSFEWTDMSFLEQKAGSTAMLIFGLAVVMVFLVLAAQYESWSLPLVVILVVPMCILSAICGVNIAGMDINIFTQIGFVVLVGLASKNAILIVEFAKKQHESGTPLRESTLEACQLRLRPIVMTSFAFILGVVPLLLSHGAGAEMRRTLGNAVFSGMIGVTAFGIFLTPVFFYTIEWLGESRLFASRPVRLIGGGLLYVLRFGYVRDAGRYVIQRHARSRSQIRLPAPANGRENGQESGVRSQGSGVS